MGQDPSKKSFRVEDVEKIAHLARIALTDQEKSEFSTQLGEILSYVDQLSSVDTQGVSPLNHPTRDLKEPTPLRKDVPKETLGAEEILKNAPKKRHNSYEVPPFV